MIERASCLRGAVVAWLWLLASCGKPAEPREPAPAPAPNEGAHESGPTPAIQGGLLSEVVPGAAASWPHATALRIISGAPSLDGHVDQTRTAWVMERVLASSAEAPARVDLGSDTVATLAPNSALARVPWLPRSFCLLNGRVGVTVPPGTARVESPVRVHVLGGTVALPSTAQVVVAAGVPPGGAEISVSAGSAQFVAASPGTKEGPGRAPRELHAGKPLRLGGRSVASPSTDERRRVFEQAAQEVGGLSSRMAPPSATNSPERTRELIALTLERRKLLAGLVVAWEALYCGAVEIAEATDDVNADAARADLPTLETSARAHRELLVLGAGSP